MALKTKRSGSVPSEHKIQSAFIEWLRYQHPRVPCFAIPNEGRRSVRTAAFLKAQGMTPGAPDVFVGIGRSALFIEFKSRNGKQTYEQCEIMQKLRAAGYDYEICRTLDEAIHLVKDLTCPKTGSLENSR